MEVLHFVLSKNGSNCYRIATVKSTREKLHINQRINMLTLKYKPKCHNQPYL